MTLGANRKGKLFVLSGDDIVRRIFDVDLLDSDAGNAPVIVEPGFRQQVKNPRKILIGGETNDILRVEVTP